jgi:CBS domain containing-hemolysin-like protein
VNNTKIIYLVGLLILDLVIAAARAGLLNTRKTRLLSMREQGKPHIDHTLDLLKERSRMRASLKLCQGILRLFMVGLVISLYSPEDFINQSPLVFSLILFLTAFLIWFAELLVERIVMGNPETWAVRMTPLGRMFVLVFSPILFLPMLLLKQKITTSEPHVNVTEYELKSLVDSSQEVGVLEKDERKMIRSIFRLGDTLAREIMVPRMDMFTLDIDTPLSDAVKEVIDSGYSRIPVYDDNIDNIMGMLYTKDMLRMWNEGNGDDVTSLRGLLREASLTPEAKKVDDLLEEMQAARIHIAIVVDEYGGVAGLVTLEDIVEEIVGEIRDEYDQGEELLFEMVNEGEYLFHGRIDMDDFNDIMSSNLSTDEADTLGGLIYCRTGRVPKVGEHLHENGLLLIVEQVSRRRILKVRAQHIKVPEDHDSQNQEENHHADR